eukprot:TRINITY_DN10556_c0_g1_i1.p1 TRINITY_DN10556_c0_g1~~TRINITY_DN10556_c0_g1_i1.p1  ORF type:complete len:515 (+),score=75.75 TRINITY_DN10556_c0_g1_i1:102-1646(+)
MRRGSTWINLSICLLALLASTHALTKLKLGGIYINDGPSSATDFELNGPGKNVFICVTSLSNVTISFLNVSCAPEPCAAIAFPSYDQELNTTCIIIDQIIAGSTLRGAVDNSPNVDYLISAEEAQSTKTGLNQTFQEGAYYNRETQARLSLLQRKWFFFEENTSFSLISLETCDSAVSIEVPSNETTFDNSEFVPRLHILPRLPQFTNDTMTTFNFKTSFDNSFCWMPDRKVSYDFEGVNATGPTRPVSFPACPNGYVYPTQMGPEVPWKIFFSVAASPVKITPSAIASLISHMRYQNGSGNGTSVTVGYFLAVRNTLVMPVLTSIAPIRINNDLILSLQLAGGAKWPANDSSHLFVYGAIRSQGDFMNSTRDRVLLYNLMYSSCFLRTHAPLYNATKPIVQIDDANYRVNLQLPLFYAFNNKPDEKVDPSYYGRLAVLVRDDRFSFKQFYDAVIPSEAFPGQPALSQLAQVLIASVSGILLIFIVMTIAFGVQLKRANARLVTDDYQAVSALE